MSLVELSPVLTDAVEVVTLSAAALKDTTEVDKLLPDVTEPPIELGPATELTELTTELTELGPADVVNALAAVVEVVTSPPEAEVTELAEVIDEDTLPPEDVELAAATEVVIELATELTELTAVLRELANVVVILATEAAKLLFGAVQQLPTLQKAEDPQSDEEVQDSPLSEHILVPIAQLP